MNNQSSNNNDQPKPFDRREAIRQRRLARRALIGDPARSSTWIAGLILILLGAAYLLQNLGITTSLLKNWWALFILLPAIGAFETTLRIYRNAGNHLTAPASGSLLVALVLTIVTIFLLFDLDWAIFGPVLIILAGIGILIKTLTPRD
jgi:hypothetical protein